MDSREMEAEDGGAEMLTEYEKQRQKRIQENNAVLAALQLPAMGSSLEKPAKKQRINQPKTSGRGPRRRSERLGTQKSYAENASSSSDQSSDSDCPSSPASRKPRDYTSGKNKDKEYEPGDDDDDQSESDDELDEDTLEDKSQKTPSVPVDISMDDEELALQQALALSMECLLEDAAANKRDFPSNNLYGRRSKKWVKLSELANASERNPQAPSSSAHTDGDRLPRWRKQKGQKDKLQFTEGEIDNFFVLFDERRTGQLSAADLEHLATAHDFTWSKDELGDMIHFFDSNHDGLLNSSDFRRMAVRFNLARS